MKICGQISTVDTSLVDENVRHLVVIRVKKHSTKIDPQLFQVV